MPQDDVKKLPHHLSNLLANIADVQLLLNIHKQVAGEGRGRKRDVEVLNRSAIVFVAAAWESYVEDLLSAALEDLIEKGADHSVFPEFVLSTVGNKHNGIKAWNLAGVGWREALRDNMKAVLASTAGAFNTPKSEKIDELYKKVIGFEGVSASWKWHRVESADAMARLDGFISLRGDIAHRVKVDRKVYKNDVKHFAALVLRLAVLTNNAVHEFMKLRLKLGDLDGWLVMNYRAPQKAKRMQEEDV